MIRALLVTSLLLPSAAEAYDLHNLTPADIFVIGRGLDKLPREDTDRGNLYGRIQADITTQDQAASKAAAEKAAADAKAIVDKALADKAAADAATKPKED